jgi:TolA-binding protein
MKRLLLLGILLLGLVMSGCGGDKAEALLETAKLEELQNNPEHARDLYREIVAKYSQREFAAYARERLDALEQQQ